MTRMNKITKQKGFVQYQGIISIVLGIVSIILPWLLYLLVELGFGWIYRSYIYGDFFSLISALLGIIFGRRGLRYSKTKAAVGIILCIIGLLFLTYHFMIWYVYTR